MVLDTAVQVSVPVKLVGVKRGYIALRNGPLEVSKPPRFSQDELIEVKCPSRKRILRGNEIE